MERNRRVANVSGITALHGELIRFSKSLHLLRQTPLHPSVPSGTAIPVLARLVNEGPMRSRQLADCFALDPSTVSRQVDQLVKHGLAQRVVDPDDGRAHLIEVTDHGITALQHFRREAAEMLGEVLRDWSEDDMLGLAAMLQRLNDDTSDRLPPLLARARHGEPTTNPTSHSQEKIA